MRLSVNLSDIHRYVSSLVQPAVVPNKENAVSNKQTSVKLLPTHFDEHASCAKGWFCFGA